MKKSSFLFFSIVVFTVFLFPSFSFSYDKDGYPYYDQYCRQRSEGNPCPGDNIGFCQSNCTSYAGYKLNKVAPIGFNNSYKGVHWGDGSNWGDAAVSAGISKNNQPLPGDIAYWESGDYGHVAFVEKVNYDGDGKPTSIDVTEYNYGTACNFGQRTSLSANNPSGYIHFLDHTYTGVACAPHSNGKQLCWSYNSNISCSSGESHFYNDKNSGVCYLANSSDCSGVIGSSKYVGGRGGGVVGILIGPGFETIPTDSATPGLPDFVAKKIELSNYNPKIYESIEAKATFKNDGVEDIDSDDKIESRFYLSQGYKEDSHSEWIRIGKEKSKGSSLDPGESHSERITFNLWEYELEENKAYNIVACIDRTEDSDNGDGEYPEEHKSNNCTSEAVFTVVASSSTTSSGKLAWSSAGQISSMTNIQIYEPNDPDTWNDNYLASDQNYGIQWSHNGPIANMRCTQIIESADPDSWNNNYLCVPISSSLYFAWSSAGPIDGMNNVWWLEGADKHTWQDNFLGYYFQEAAPPTPPPTYNLSVYSIALDVEDKVKLFPTGFFNLSITIVNNGNSISQDVSVGYYLEDTLLGTHIISASNLTSGKYYSDAFVNIPAPDNSGYHSAKICIDSINVINETDETDNCRSIGFDVVKPINPAVMMQLFQ